MSNNLHNLVPSSFGPVCCKVSNTKSDQSRGRNIWTEWNKWHLLLYNPLTIVNFTKRKLKTLSLTISMKGKLHPWPFKIKFCHYLLVVLFIGFLKLTLMWMFHFQSQFFLLKWKIHILGFTKAIGLYCILWCFIGLFVCNFHII